MCAAFSAFAKSGASNCTQRTDDFVSGNRTQTWMLAAFLAVAPVVTATATPATATTRRTLAALPLSLFISILLPGDAETLLRKWGNVHVDFRHKLAGIVSSILDRDSSPALARADDGVADLGRSVSVLERRPVGRHL